MNRSKFLLIIILTVLLLRLKSGPADLNAIRENNSSIEENSKSAGNHAPFYIEGNDALATFIEDEGLSGDGTFASPYIIENFIINASTAIFIDIRSTDAYLIIRDCTIESRNFGIYLSNATNVNISNNLLSNNYYGIYLDSSSNNTLSGNTASYNRKAGIYLSSSSNNNTLSGNMMYSSGLWLINSYDNNIDTSNKVNDKSVRYYENTLGVHLSGESDVGQVILINCDDSKIEGLYISKTSIGITVSDSFNCSISENTIIDSYYGIWLSSSSNNNILSGNTASYNDRVGIHLLSSSNNMLSGNTANNTDYGILLGYGSNNNILSGNNASYNNQCGIYLPYSRNNTLSGNIANNNDYGIYLMYSSNNTLSGNTANNNVDKGIRLLSSSNNTLSGNNASYNNDDGIRLESWSNNNMLSGNTASYNNEYGIRLDFRSNNNTICFNNIYENTKGQAFEEDDCTDNQWDNGTTGNYWGGDITNRYPNCPNDGKIWNAYYWINGDGNGVDHFPLVNAVISPETTTMEDTTADTTAETTTTDGTTPTTTTTTTTPTTTPSWTLILLLLSFIAMLPLRRRKKKS